LPGERCGAVQLDMSMIEPTVADAILDGIAANATP
jgi:hypothetical protein